MSATRLESLGAHTPAHSVSSDVIAEQLGLAQPVDVAAITGIAARRVCDSTQDRYESSFDLALSAIDDCLSRSSYGPTDLDVVISTSITRSTGPESLTYDPAFALMLRNEIGATNARAFDISNACAGMTTGIMLLDRMIRSGAARTGLVVSGERITPIMHTAIREISAPYDPQFASLTVGDAAAAVILDGAGDDDDHIDFVDLMTTADAAQFCLGMPSDSSDGLAMYTDNRSMQTPERLMLSMTRLDDVLGRHGRSWATENFDFLIHHQFSGPAIERLKRMGEQHFGAPPPPVLNVFEQFGNTASTSHYLALRTHLDAGRIPKGSKILLVTLASGIVYGYLSLTTSRLAG